MEKKSNNKTIFWTSLISIILTLTAVVYFTNYMRDFDEGEFEYFLKSLFFICIIFWVPTTIIYRLIFGKINREDILGYNTFLLLSFFMILLFLDALFETGIIRGNARSTDTALLIIVFLASLIITKLLSIFIFIPEERQDDK